MKLLPGALAAWFLCACGSKGEPVESTWQAQPEPSAEPPEMAVPTEGTPEPGAVSSTGERTESPRNPSSSSTTTPTGASAPPSASGSQTEVTAGREMAKNVGGGTGLESDAGAAVNGGSSNGESSDVGFPPVDEPSPAPPLGVSVEQPRAALPLPRQEHAVAALDGEIYLIGGFHGPQATASIQVYSPESDEWRDAADFPEPLHHSNVAVVGGKLYVLGYHTAEGLNRASGRSFVYTPPPTGERGLGEWRELPPLPVLDDVAGQEADTKRGSSCVAALGGVIYLFAGANDRGTLLDSSAFDTANESWEILPAMPVKREHCVAAAVDGRVYIVSGRADSIQGVEPESWVYDPQARSYEERAPIPTPRGGAAGALLRGRIYVFGGEGNPNDPSGVFSEVEVYDPRTDSWESLPAMQTARHGYGAATVGDRIYLPGGAVREGFGPETTHTVFFHAD